MPKKTESIDDAIRVQQAVVNQCVEEHTENHRKYTVSGERVRREHETLAALLARKAAL